MGKPGQPYRPTSGTEGECFHERFCYQCIHERWVHRQKEDRDEDKCVVLTATLGLGTDDPGYPKEWTYGEDGKPTCTKFVKFDWGTDDDPNEPDSPRPVEPDDPAQLLMPFDITGRHKLDPFWVKLMAVEGGDEPRIQRLLELRHNG